MVYIGSINIYNSKSHRPL